MWFREKSYADHVRSKTATITGWKPRKDDETFQNHCKKMESKGKSAGAAAIEWGIVMIVGRLSSGSDSECREALHIAKALLRNKNMSDRPDAIEKVIHQFVGARFG